MKIDTMFLLLFLFSVLVSSCSQIILKKSANNQHDSKLKEILNPMVAGAYICFLGSSLLTTLAYRGIPLSMGPVLEATSYIYIVLLSRVFLKEKITKRKLMGNLLIIIGILISAWNF